MDIKDLQNLIRFVAKAGVSEVSYKEKDFEIKIKTTSEGTVVAMPQAVMQQPIQQVAAQPSVPQTATEKPADSNADNGNYVTIKSPILGTFYRKPSPDKPVFVNIGDSIKPGTVLCVVEAMKLFNEIEAEISGTIVKVLVDDSSPVEYDQPLFIVDPS